MFVVLAVDGTVEMNWIAPTLRSFCNHPDVVVRSFFTIHRSLRGEHHLCSVRRDHRVEVAIPTGERCHFGLLPFTVFEFGVTNNIDIEAGYTLREEHRVAVGG